MRVQILSEYGYREALFGLGLSYGKTSQTVFEEFDTATLSRLATSLAGLGYGHDKFLRMLMVTLDITAPLYWWKEFDTYKVGTVTQSESTMHTLMKNPITSDCFEYGCVPNTYIEHLESLRQEGNFTALNACLPQSWLQRRIVMTNYAQLGNIIWQRHGHKLLEWHAFVDAVFDQCAFPNLLASYRGEKKDG